MKTIDDNHPATILRRKAQRVRRVHVSCHFDPFGQAQVNSGEILLRSIAFARDDGPRAITFACLASWRDDKNLQLACES